MFSCFSKFNDKNFNIDNKNNEVIEEDIIAIVIPIVITFFVLLFEDTLIIAVFNDKQLIDKKSIMLGNINDYNDIPCSPKYLVKITLFNNPNILIIKFVINNINVFFKSFIKCFHF